MFRLTVLILSLVSLCLCATPVYEAKHYKVFQLESGHRNVDKRQEIQEQTRNGLRSVIELPYNDTVPLDDGSPLFGDIEFYSTRKDGELIVRDTIVNQNRYENLLIVYNRTFPGYYIEDFRIFNVGRERGFTQYALISHNTGYVETEILVPAYNTVRIFAEIYIRANPLVDTELNKQ